MKVRDLQRLLLDRGCTPLRIKGSHEIWSLPLGVCLPIVVNHKNADVSRTVLSSCRKAFERAGLRWD